MDLEDFRVDFLAMLLPWLRRQTKILKTLLKEEGGECRTSPDLVLSDVRDPE